MKNIFFRLNAQCIALNRKIGSVNSVSLLISFDSSYHGRHLLSILNYRRLKYNICGEKIKVQGTGKE